MLMTLPLKPTKDSAFGNCDAFEKARAKLFIVLGKLFKLIILYIINESSLIASLSSMYTELPFVTNILYTNTSTFSPTLTSASLSVLLAVSFVPFTAIVSSVLSPLKATLSTTPSAAELLYF